VEAAERLGDDHRQDDGRDPESSERLRISLSWREGRVDGLMAERKRCVCCLYQLICTRLVSSAATIKCH
jgi:hypothetical protein